MTDTVVEHIHEDAKMEEKENENGEKEMVEVSPASDKAKIVKRPVSISDPASAVDKASKRMQQRRLY